VSPPKHKPLYIPPLTHGKYLGMASEYLEHISKENDENKKKGEESPFLICCRLTDFAYAPGQSVAALWGRLDSWELCLWYQWLSLYLSGRWVLRLSCFGQIVA
jgi:hypothetical protein